jgi:acetamidase/formamidase
LKVIDGWKDENLHSKWSGDLEPIETISNQETFRVEIPDSSTKQIKENFTDASLKTLDSSKFDMAVGPIYIEEAEPGDLLEVKISKIETSNWGWSAILKDFGLLKGKFDEKLVLWSVANGYVRSARKGFLEGVRIPSRPFLGVVGTAPEEGEFPMIPPQYFGGNMDNRLLGEGSRLYLPVSREGGLLSFADPHASQGDGEVCGTAVETSASVSVSVNVVKNRKTKYPRIESRDNGQGEVLVTQSFSPDLLRGAKEAVEEMIALMAERGFSGEEAYVLCSVAGNLRISEIVDEPNYGVSMVIPAQLLTR